MKKHKLAKLVLVSLFLAAAVSGALAGTVTVADSYFGGTNIMVVPPARDYGTSLLQIPERTATNSVVQGEVRRQDQDVLIAAVAGTTGTSMNTNLFIYTNGTTVVTNTSYKATPITVPLSGLTAADGTVYWHRVPRTRSGMVLTVTIEPGDTTVTLSDPGGGVIPVTSTTQFTAASLPGFLDALYATKDTCSNVTASLLEIP